MADYSLMAFLMGVYLMVIAATSRNPHSQTMIVVGTIGTVLAYGSLLFWFCLSITVLSG